MRTILDRIIEQITSNPEAFTSQGLIAPQTVDIYLGQPIAPDQFEFALPAIFIDYMADYNNNLVYIYLHVLQDYSEDTESYAPDRENGMRFNDHLMTIKRLLHGLRSSRPFGVLRLYQEAPTQTDYFYYHTITFCCKIETDLYVETEKYVDAGPVEVDVQHGRLKDHTPM